MAGRLAERCSSRSAHAMLTVVALAVVVRDARGDPLWP
jgi:hypothetical protein